MGNPAYDARRAVERAEAERDKASAESAQAAFEALTAFMQGRAALLVTPPPPQATGMPWQIRLVRDQ